AFIYFRYARNLLDGYGPVWNPGEHVEGFSSPLWLALVTIGEAIAAPPVMFVRVLGTVLNAAAIAGTYMLARRLGAPRAGASFAVLACTLLTPLYYWAPAGLETSLVAALLVGSAIACASGGPAVLAIGLLGVARPEGPALALLAMFAFVYVDR